ncbi:MAG: glycosyltransferase [Burkholderiales bacterium]|nr:glycosyltransferase [Burkholderiales bacterium]
MKIVLAAHSALGGTFVVGSHHLARELARAGHAVAHVSTPLTPAHWLRRTDPEVERRFGLYRAGGERSAEGVFNYVPMGLAPWAIGRRFVPRANPLVVCLPSLRRVLAQAGFDRPDLLVVDQPKMIGIERVLQARRLVYRATDLYAEMLDDPSILVAERALCAAADLVVGTSTPVVEHLESLMPGRQAQLVENGVEFDAFTTPQPAPPEYASLPRPIAVYVGALDARFDDAMVAAAARAVPAASLVLVGPEDAAHPLTALAGLTNVHRLGRRPYASVPGYLQHADLALLPMSRHGANAGRSPMKIYEYGAAGLPVVATRTAELARRALGYVHLVEDADGFAAAARTVLASDADALAGAKRQARDVARQYDWAGRARLLLERLDAATAR